ncbi:MAG: Asp-tRNA(Asn)/Glu-tRNA(Gln) amidotransferase subunit GatC [Verrucomicrobiales bacterium]|jgi:aspartyl-tRNA(Asn)/glutamyl-tRNA(Gln) amidotransferase subunit C|nr:Asp-tRNA(Asn)/Glu-tRNA(Gln) amidotransferase subunit GatC [Verrucomicrobiales bacterium]
MDVRKVAHLARIHLSDEEAETFQGQFEQILHYVEQLNQIDVEGIEPTAHAAAVFDVIRDDVALSEHQLSQDEALRNAPATAHDQIKMPKVVE